MDTKFNDVEIVFLYKYLMNFRSSNCCRFQTWIIYNLFFK